jgi:hypothetical protein
VSGGGWGGPDGGGAAVDRAGRGVRRWEPGMGTEERLGVGDRCGSSADGWGWMDRQGDFFGWESRVGPTKLPPSAYILHKISKPPNANKKGRRE